MKIMICTVDSPAVYKLADYLAELFPHAEYHIVTVVKPVYRRVTLTKYYEKVLMDTITKAHARVETLLKKHGVSNIIKHVLRGKPSDLLKEYSETYNIDLVAITPRATAKCEGLGRTARRLIEKCRKPILLYTPISDVPFTTTLHVLEIGDAVLPEDILAILQQRKEVVVEHRTINELEDRMTGYDLFVVKKRIFLDLLHKHICRKIWSPILILP